MKNLVLKNSFFQLDTPGMPTYHLIQDELNKLKLNQQALQSICCHNAANPYHDIDKNFISPFASEWSVIMYIL